VSATQVRHSGKFANENKVENRNHNPKVASSSLALATETPLISTAYRFSKAALYETGHIHTFGV
jgi:hypothetical protein